MKKVFSTFLIICVAFIGVLLLCPSHLLQHFAIYSWIPFWAFIICVGILKSNGGWYILSRKLRGILWCKGKNRNILISENVRITNRDRVCIGNNVAVGKGVDIFPMGGNFPSKVIIGDNVNIGDYNRIASCNCVEIGEDVLFAAYVHITDHSHEFKDVMVPIVRQGIYSKGPVKIGKGSWLGYRSEVLSGVTIGEHCVIAAGAVVTKDIPPFSVAAGVPARVVKRYDFDKKEWVDV